MKNQFAQDSKELYQFVSQYASQDSEVKKYLLAYLTAGSNLKKRIVELANSAEGANLELALVPDNNFVDQIVAIGEAHNLGWTEDVVTKDIANNGVQHVAIVQN